MDSAVWSSACNSQRGRAGRRAVGVLSCSEVLCWLAPAAVLALV